MTYMEGMYPVSARKTVDGWATPGISFEDYTRMSTQQRKQSGERRLPTPAWAINDKALRELIVVFMEERAGFRKKQKGSLRERLKRAEEAVIAQRPRLLEILGRLCREYVKIKQLGLNPETSDVEWNNARVQPYLAVPDPENGTVFEGEARHDAEKKRRRELEIEISGIDTYLRYTATGGADVIAAVVYLYFRAALDSVGVGAELNLKPPHVRQTIWRLHQTAKKLWPSQATGNSSASKDAMERDGNNNAGGNADALGVPQDANQTTGKGSYGAGLAEPMFSSLEG